MSKKANTAAIGGFVVGAVALVIVGIMIFGGGGFFTEKQKYVMFFEGSVKGLNVGAPVDFKGVRVGTVTEIKLLLDRSDLSVKIPVYIEIEPGRMNEVFAGADTGKQLEEAETKTIIAMLVQRGLRAQLGIQSLVTGLLYVDLDFNPDKPARLVGVQTGYTELPTIPSNLEQISKAIEMLPLEELANKLLLAIEGIEGFVNSPELKEIVKELNQTIKEAQTLVRNIEGEVKPLAANVDKTLTTAQKVLRNVDDRVGPLASGLEQTVTDTRGLVRNIDKRVVPLMASIEETFAATRSAVKQADETLAAVEGLTGENSGLRYELLKALKELSAAARAIRVMADYLQRHPEVLIRGKGGYGDK